MKKLFVLVAVTFIVVFFSVPFEYTASAEDVFHGGDIIYTYPVKAVMFSHAFHVEELELDCDFCHEDIFEIEALLAQQDANFTMEGLRQGEYCGHCHDGFSAFSSDTQCARCHIGVKGYNAQAGSQESEEY